MCVATTKGFFSLFAVKTLMQQFFALDFLKKGWQLAHASTFHTIVNGRSRCITKDSFSYPSSIDKISAMCVVCRHEHTMHSRYLYIQAKHATMHFSLPR